MKPYLDLESNLEPKEELKEGFLPRASHHQKKEYDQKYPRYSKLNDAAKNSLVTSGVKQLKC